MPQLYIDVGEYHESWIMALVVLLLDYSGGES